MKLVEYILMIRTQGDLIQMLFWMILGVLLSWLWPWKFRTIRLRKQVQTERVEGYRQALRMVNAGPIQIDDGTLVSIYADTLEIESINSDGNFVLKRK